MGTSTVDTVWCPCVPDERMFSHSFLDGVIIKRNNSWGQQCVSIKVMIGSLGSFSKIFLFTQWKDRC